MPGNYVKNEFPICDSCNQRTFYLTTGVYHCVRCALEFATYKGMLNVYCLTEDGERQLLRTTEYLTSVAENTFPANTPVFLSRREIGRISMLQMVVNESLPTKKAARFMGVSVQWVRCLKNRFVSQGEAALIDGHTRSGRRPLPVDMRTRIITLARSDYAGYSLRKMQAALSEQGINLHYSTIDRILQGGMSQ